MTEKTVALFLTEERLSRILHNLPVHDEMRTYLQRAGNEIFRWQ